MPKSRSVVRAAGDQLDGLRAELDEFEVVSGSDLFDPQWYLDHYPDVAMMGLDPVEHYLASGAAEGRDPGPWFSTIDYLEANPDVAQAHVNPVVHYLRFGRDECRAVRPSGEESQRAARSDRPCTAAIISGAPATLAHTYRVEHVAEALSSIGVVSAIIPGEEIVARFGAVARADILILWRVAPSAELVEAIDRVRSRGSHVVLDVDDLAIDPELASPEELAQVRTTATTAGAVRRNHVAMQLGARAASLCTASTDEVAGQIQLLETPAIVIPNGFDAETHRRSRHIVRKPRSGDGLVRIGYLERTRAYEQDIAGLADPIARVLDRYEHCRLVLFDDGRSGPSIDVDAHPVLSAVADRIEHRSVAPIETMVSEIGRLDINVVPREVGNPFREAGGEQAFVEAALLDVPTIASATGPFRRVIEHGRNGFLVRQQGDWHDLLRLLVEDEPLRRTIGRDAYRTALARYGPLQRSAAVGRILARLRGGLGAQHGAALDARLLDEPGALIEIAPATVEFASDRGDMSDVSVVINLAGDAPPPLGVLEATLVQSSPGLDLVIVDDQAVAGRRDAVLDWVRDHASQFNRVVVRRTAQPIGPGPSRDVAIDTAETPFILPLHDSVRLGRHGVVALTSAIGRGPYAFAYQALPPDARLDASQLLDKPVVGGVRRRAVTLIAKEAWAAAGGFGSNGDAHDCAFGRFWHRVEMAGLVGTRCDETATLEGGRVTSSTTSPVLARGD